MSSQARGRRPFEVVTGAQQRTVRKLFRGTTGALLLLIMASAAGSAAAVRVEGDGLKEYVPDDDQTRPRPSTVPERYKAREFTRPGTSPHLNRTLAFLGIEGLLAQSPTKPGEPPHCDFTRYPGIVWSGTERKMTIRDLAAYCAPVFWFSPDEPTMAGKKGKDIRIPESFPFEENTDAPVVYYQYDRIFERLDAEGPGYIHDPTDKNSSMIDLNNIVAADLKFLAYFSREEGLGGHAHDVEPAIFRIFVLRSDEWAKKVPEIHCDEVHYIVGVSRITAEAHGLYLYYNTLITDQDTKFPMHLLVEEGKHGLCTDKNGDGYYTPGYDVNRHVNDAWGIRDIIRSGALYSGGYQAWMAKVRRPEHRIFPPLPEDSHLRQSHMHHGQYASANAIYELRAFPASDNAESDALLQQKMEEKEQLKWPLLVKNATFEELKDWLGGWSFLKSLAFSTRIDGGRGTSFAFPFFIVKSLGVSLTGGYVVHRVYTNNGLRDRAWTLMYTPSASRWIDEYFSAGIERNVQRDEAKRKKIETNFVVETGIKLRLNLTKSSSKIRNFFADYWGFRFGVKNTGFGDIDRLNYVFEIGGGIW